MNPFNVICDRIAGDLGMHRPSRRRRPRARLFRWDLTWPLVIAAAALFWALFLALHWPVA